MPTFSGCSIRKATGESTARLRNDMVFTVYFNGILQMVDDFDPDSNVSEDATTLIFRECLPFDCSLLLFLPVMVSASGRARW